MKKVVRERVWLKYNKRCAYCGNELEYKKMQVDHIVPIYRNDSDLNLERMNIVRGKDEESNYNPSCARCNRWKSTFTIEKFRAELVKLLSRLRRYSRQYLMAINFGLVKETEFPLLFYYEKVAIQNKPARQVKCHVCSGIGVIQRSGVDFDLCARCNGLGRFEM